MGALVQTQRNCQNSLMAIGRWAGKNVATKAQQAAKKNRRGGREKGEKKKAVVTVGQARSQAAETVGKAKQVAVAAAKKTAELGSAEIQAVLRNKKPKLSEASAKKLQALMAPTPPN